MIRKWLTWVNLLVGGLILALILIGLAFLFARPAEISVSDKPPPKTGLPKKAYTMPKEAYDAIGEPTLSLQFAPMSMQLPDIKRFLLYYGKNGRPDAVAELPLLHFAFTGNKTISSVTPGEKLYILYDRKLNPPQYIFSPNNAASPLWIEASSEDSVAQVKVTMKGENGEIIREPDANANFTLPEKEFVRSGGVPWEIGKNRVDATLLARQRARWFGPDLFMQRHGGKEYAEQSGKQRIDFGEGDEGYSVFVGPNDSLVWEKERWQSVKPGPLSLGKPLLVVKKIDDRLMTLELWDPEGKGKVIMNILRSSDVAAPVNIPQLFKFVGARTRTQFVFEINKERVLLSPKDWLLFTKAGWIKLVSPQEIDDYVDRKTVGPLFVFDEIEKREDKQILKGTLFNASRTDMQPVEIPLQQTMQGLKAPPSKPGVKGEKPQKEAQGNKGRQMLPSLHAPIYDEDDEGEDSGSLDEFEDEMEDSQY